MAAVAFVAALLVVSTLALWVFQVSAVSARGSLGHLYGNGAFYAAESGMEFALRELSANADLDGDGVIGTISDDANTNNDPSLGQGTFNVSAVDKVLTATGNWQGHARVVEATLN